MKLIVGLGNPGKQYEKTRHNMGFSVLDLIADAFGADAFQNNEKFKGAVARFAAGTDDVILAKPATFMNRSGDAVSRIAVFYKIAPTDIAVVHDEMDLPAGEIKFSFGRGAAGHNGVASIIAALGTEEFLRVRIGIGKGKNVLKKPGMLERSKINKALDRAAEALAVWIEKGTDAAVQFANSGEKE
jgi:PTH1 family peptidyl-tRNA hydrolase